LRYNNDDNDHDNDDNDDDYVAGYAKSRNSESDCCIGYTLVLLNAVTVISAFSKCYSVNDEQQHCFYTDGSMLSWDKAREFCARKYSTLPIITDINTNNAFQRFMSKSNEIMNVSYDYVWLDAHARHVNDSVKWHWIDGQPSG